MAFHAQGELRHHGFADPFPDLTAGAFGVDLFFVVSGFIMVFASDALLGRAGGAMTFLARRLARVAPLYWAFTALFAAIAVLLGRIAGHAPASPVHIAASFLFLPAPRPEDGAYLPVDPLGWTLNYEMFFYVCFAAAIRLRRGAAVAVLSTGLIGLAVLGRLVALQWPLFYWADPIIVEFVFGLWIASAHRAGWRVPPRLGWAALAAAATAVSAYGGHMDAWPSWRCLAWGLPAAAIVASVLGIEIGDGPAWRAAVRLGDASYSLYLVHSALFIAAFALLSRVMAPHVVPPVLYALGLMAGSIAAATVLYRLFERPVTRALNVALARRPRA